MKNIAFVITLITCAAAGSASAGDSSGTLNSFNGADRILVLHDGSQYFVPEDVAVPLFRSGSRLTFSAEEREGRKVITHLRMAE